MAWNKIVGILMSLVVVASENSISTGVTDMDSALSYLAKYGYLDPALTNSISGEIPSTQSVRKSIMEFQAFAGLEQTGVLDDKTLEKMNTPRCGVKDKFDFGEDSRKKRYALQGSLWGEGELTYTITRYPRGLRKDDVDREIAAAFRVWQDVTNLTFKQVSCGSKVHIEIRFEKAEHGDGFPFDGPGKVLTHAFFPNFGGDAHFDDTATWTIGTYEGINLFQVAAHAFGHSLGIHHSDVQSAVMYPYYQGYRRDFELDSDDVLAIQDIYGEKSYCPSVVNLCADASFDAIVTMSDKKTYVFKGSEYWKLTNNGFETGYPRPIFSNWGGLPSNLDAAFTGNDGKTYFFKGSYFWSFTNLKMDSGYPMSIKKGFPGIPDEVDAAFVWSGNGKIYFFKGYHYWRFDQFENPPVKNDYPLQISGWGGLPGNIDDALRYPNGYTYFFKDGLYYRYNDVTQRVNANYPLPVGVEWFGCRAEGN